MATSAWRPGYGYDGYGGYGGYGFGSPYYGGYGYGSPYYGGYRIWRATALLRRLWLWRLRLAYYGWYDNYYYPGSGYYVYDSYRRPYAMTTTQRAYWSTAIAGAPDDEHPQTVQRRTGAASTAAPDRVGREAPAGARAAAQTPAGTATRRLSLRPPPDQHDRGEASSPARRSGW